MQYFFERAAEVTPETGHLARYFPPQNSGSALCPYYLCYTFAALDLSELHYSKVGEFDKLDTLCRQWLARHEQRTEAMTQRGERDSCGSYHRRRFVKVHACALHGLERHGEALDRLEEVLRVLEEEKAAEHQRILEEL
ncbi:unnamed protein product [Amoebophrya sp. A25]|nr:unnamed protein product [Amoebophrya sp. A25]|eukprot:GSA25T00004388001.1